MSLGACSCMLLAEILKAYYVPNAFLMNEELKKMFWQIKRNLVFNKGTFFSFSEIENIDSFKTHTFD